MRVELAGGLGIGKSTLCRALERMGFNCIYENLDNNLFLQDAFIDPAKFRFPSQMWFALTKFHELNKFYSDDRINVLDQAILNVLAYTNLFFGDEDPEGLRLVQDTFAHLEHTMGKPDLIIHLECSPEVQMERISGRGRSHEKAIEMDYLVALHDEINRLMDVARAEGQEVLVIDTEKVNIDEHKIFAADLARQVADQFDINIQHYMNKFVSEQKRHGAQLPLDNANAA
jgi:deoxyadenosine/deoxycytidine kinase|tara:strand:- start:31482 stop:32168 length:687 start_codon:yes stop_codon:yes gene_type:complete